MRVILDFQSGYCHVYKESTDPYFNSESRFLYWIKRELIKLGYDVIKKLAWKDGNLVSDDLHYIRTRSFSGKDNEFYIYNNYYAIEDSKKYFNEDGYVSLQLITQPE